MFLSNNKWIDSGIVGYSVSVILHWIWLFYKSMNDILTAIVNTSKKKMVQNPTFSNESYQWKCLHLPLSDSGVQSLPVTVLNGVVVVEVLLLVLLHRSGGSGLFGGKNVPWHLLLLLAPQSDYLITDGGQFGAAAGIPFLGAFAWLTFHWLRQHQEESQTFHVPSLGIDHECVQLRSSGSSCREDIHQQQAGAKVDWGW